MGGLDPIRPSSSPCVRSTRPGSGSSSVSRRQKKRRRPPRRATAPRPPTTPPTIAPVLFDLRLPYMLTSKNGSDVFDIRCDTYPVLLPPVCDELELVVDVPLVDEELPEAVDEDGAPVIPPAGDPAVLLGLASLMHQSGPF